MQIIIQSPLGPQLLPLCMVPSELAFAILHQPISVLKGKIQKVEREKNQLQRKVAAYWVILYLYLLSLKA